MPPHGSPGDAKHRPETRAGQRERCREERIRQCWKEEITRLRTMARSEFKLLLAAIREHRDLAERLDLMVSVEGVGLKTAVDVLIRMPEIGSLSREEATALAVLRPMTTIAEPGPANVTSPVAVSG